MIKRISALIALIGLFFVVLTNEEIAHWGPSYLEVPAFLLVFVAPFLTLIAFNPKQVKWNFIFQRLSQLLKKNDKEMIQDFTGVIAAGQGRVLKGPIIDLGQNHSDSFARYSAEVLSQGHSNQQVEKLLIGRIQNENNMWSALSDDISFLAKMAPYFGMMATVFGMIKLMGNMDDFSQINTHMSTALYGTLYGIFAFLIIFSPIQKGIEGIRKVILKRNKKVLKIFSSILKNEDILYIKEESKEIY